MKFNSMKEYFYKLNNTGYQLLMVPIILIILYYSQLLAHLTGLVVLDKAIERVLLMALSGLCLAVLVLAQLLAKRKANAIAKEVGLGIKLEKLGAVLIRKMVALALAIWLMPVALLLTGNGYFSMAFGVLLLWFFLQWPRPNRVCQLLKLRGDEKEMVITRGEAFK